MSQKVRDLTNHVDQLHGLIDNGAVKPEDARQWLVDRGYTPEIVEEWERTGGGGGAGKNWFWGGSTDLWSEAVAGGNPYFQPSVSDMGDLKGRSERKVSKHGRRSRTLKRSFGG